MRRGKLPSGVLLENCCTGSCREGLNEYYMRRHAIEICPAANMCITLKLIKIANDRELTRTLAATWGATERGGNLSRKN